MTVTAVVKTVMGVIDLRNTKDIRIVTVRKLMILDLPSLVSVCYGLPSTTSWSWSELCCPTVLGWWGPQIVTCTLLFTGLPTATTCPCSISSSLPVPTPWLPQTLDGLLFTLQPGGTVPPVWRLCST